MSYNPPGKKRRKPHPSDIHHALQVSRAVSYTAHFRKGNQEAFTVPAATLAEARKLAAGLTAEHGKWGRRAMVYGITPEGWSIPIADSD